MVHLRGIQLTQITLSIAITFSFFLAPPLKSQTVGPVPELAAELSPHFVYDLGENIYYSQLAYSKVASSIQVAPEINSAGSVYTTFLSIGARTKDFDEVDFRWRAGLLHMDLIRIPISMGATLIDYNQSGYIDLDVRWINLRLGPSVYLGNPRNYFTLRAVGHAGITTVRFGDFAYEGLASTQDLSLRKRSYEVGYLGELKIFFLNTVQIATSLKYRHMLGGIRPQIYEAKGSLGFRLNGELSLSWSYALEVVEAGSSSLDRSYLGVSMGVLF